MKVKKQKTGNLISDWKSIKAEEFALPDNVILIQMSNENLVLQILTLSDAMQEAISMHGFSADASQALFLFISEISNNALKARGSYEVVKMYGSFENLVLTQEKHREIINGIVTRYYSQTEILIRWNLMSDNLSLEISNNTPLTDYFEKRVIEAMNKSPNITEEFIEQLSMADNIFDTRASGIGMGLSMAVSYAKIAGGAIDYDKSKDGWTTFRLQLNREHEKI